MSGPRHKLLVSLAQHVVSSLLSRPVGGPLAGTESLPQSPRGQFSVPLAVNSNVPCGIPGMCKRWRASGSRRVLVDGNSPRCSAGARLAEEGRKYA